jgi:hypothetical protein
VSDLFHWWTHGDAQPTTLISPEPLILSLAEVIAQTSALLERLDGVDTKS